MKGKTRTTREEVAEVAHLLGWECRSHGTYLRGDYCIQVDYSHSGHVTAATLYRFFRVEELNLQERAVGKHKREEVLAWMAR